MKRRLHGFGSSACRRRLWRSERPDWIITGTEKIMKFRKMVYQTDCAGKGTVSSGNRSQPGSGNGYHGDPETGVQSAHTSGDSLLFLFAGDGAGICENGILPGSRGSCDFQKCKKN